MTYLQVGKRFTAERPTVRMPAMTQAALAALTLPDSTRPTTKMAAVRPEEKSQ